MIRRSFLAAVALTVVGGVAAPALADTLDRGSEGNVVCVLGTNHTNSGIRDGICVWFPGAR